MYFDWLDSRSSKRLYLRYIGRHLQPPTAGGFDHVINTDNLRTEVPPALAGQVALFLGGDRQQGPVFTAAAAGPLGMRLATISDKVR
jgi:hypothetical protein